MRAKLPFGINPATRGDTQMKRFLLATAAMTALLVFASPAVRADGTGSVTVLLNAVGQSLQEELL